MASQGKNQRPAIEGIGAVFVASANPMLIADDERRYVDANHAACSVFGLSRERILSRRIDDFTPPELRPHLPEIWAEFLENGSQTGEFELFLGEGHRVRTEFSATANVSPGRHLSIFFRWEDEDRAAEAVGVPEEPERGAVLSAREREVLTRLALGEDNEGVAKRLYISVETVRTHVRNARTKLGASSRAHAVALALTAGEIELDTASAPRPAWATPPAS